MKNFIVKNGVVTVNNVDFIHCLLTPFNQNGVYRDTYTFTFFNTRSITFSVDKCGNMYGDVALRFNGLFKQKEVGATSDDYAIELHNIKSEGRHVEFDIILIYDSDMSRKSEKICNVRVFEDYIRVDDIRYDI